MPRMKTTSEVSETRRGRPASSPEEQEKLMISLAMSQAEKQLRDGTASSQVICHFLKLATANAELERENLRIKNELDKTKIESMKQMERIEELYSQALNAMKRYSGEVPVNEEL